MTAASATVRARGPTASCVNETGITPARLISPRVGRKPTRPLAEDGERIEFTVSEPVPTVAKLAAKAAPVPPEEPPGVRDSSYRDFWSGHPANSTLARTAPVHACSFSRESRLRFDGAAPP